MAELGDNYTVPTDVTLRDIMALVLRDRVESMRDEEGKGLPAGMYKRAHQLLDDEQRTYDYMLDAMEPYLDELSHKLLDTIDVEPAPEQGLGL